MRLAVNLPVETVPLPTPYGVGPVNAFVIVAEPMTMIDAGVNTVDAENALKLGFAAKGLFIESVERILITHGHPDHYGLVPLICNGSHTAHAYMGEREVERITDDRLIWECGRRLREAGFPEPLLKDVARLERRVHRVHQVAQLKCVPIKAGETFEFRDFVLEAISLPGHTEGHLGYLEPKRRVLFAGDTLLPHSSPNALLEPTLEPEGDWPSRRRHSLKDYLDTLDRLQSLDLTIVYPGHGPVMTNPSETICYMREHHARRLDVVWDCLTKDGKSAYQVCSALYPNTESYDRFLAVCEVIAHLDLLVDQARVCNEIREDGVEYFFVT
jgi:glyoxylase-like metal-dependent hydrolase (beta-lactamase superfamily II)